MLYEAEDRQGQMERSNSITLEQRENEAKERIINIFNMRSKIQKWKNNTQDNNKKEERGKRTMIWCSLSYYRISTSCRTFLQKL